jgi:hypothetical protein
LRDENEVIKQFDSALKDEIGNWKQQTMNLKTLNSSLAQEIAALKHQLESIVRQRG